MPRTNPRENRLEAKTQALAEAKNRGDWYRVFVIASQWVMAEAKAVSDLDPGKADDIYQALSAPLIDAAKRLNQQKWKINA